MPKVPVDEERERRITMEIVVDPDGPEEHTTWLGCESMYMVPEGR